MAHSTDSAGCSPELIRRYQLAVTHFVDASNALTNGTKTISTTIGATPPEASTARATSTGLRSITDDELLERIARLATTPRGPDSAPLTTYRTTSTEHGEVYQATSEYIDWLRRKVPGYGECGSVTRATPGGSAEGSGGSPTLKSIDF